MRTLFLLIILVVCPVGLLGGEPDKDLHEKCLYPTVVVHTPKGSSGSGVIVRSDKISDNEYMNIAISCQHVVDDSDLVKIAYVNYQNWSRVKDGEVYTAKVYKTIRDEKKHLDLAILIFLSDKKLYTAEIDFEENYYIGNDVVGCGCAVEGFPRIDYGKINGIYEGHLRNSVLTIMGDSGGPLYHNNKLIGIKEQIATINCPSNNPLSPPITVPLFNYADAYSIGGLKIWNEKEPIEFVWNKEKTTPKLITLFLQVLEFEPK